MKLRIVAVGQRQPAWADAAVDTFLKRFPAEMRLEVHAVKAEPRSGGKSAEQMMGAEATRLVAAAPRGARQVALDERGDRSTTLQLASRLEAWRHDGRDVVLLIGGPDGLAPALRDGADERLRLSDLTLPHALARVLLAEALYRAWSVISNHPYHRE